MLNRKNFYYPLAFFSYNLTLYAFSNRIQFFYIDVLGLGAAAISVAWFVFGLWNAINDPLMGQLSDRTRSRWGRRIPYIRFGAIPLGISFFILWTPPQGNPVLTVAYFLMAVFMFDTFSTLLLMALNALFPEITDGVRERANLAAARETMSGVGLILAFILAPILSTRIGYPAMGALIGAAAALGFIFSVTGIKENPERQAEQPLGFIESIRATLRNRPFRWFLGAAMMREFNFITLSATVPFWRKYVLDLTAGASLLGLNLSQDIQEVLLLAAPFVLAIPSLQIWRAITPRLGARRTWMLASLTWIPGLVVIGLANNFLVGVLGTALIAPGLAGYMMLFVVTLSEITDYDARLNGAFREGTFFGITGLFMRLAFSLQAITFAVLLDPSGYDPSVAVQPASAVNAIRFIIAGAPIIACLLSVYFLNHVRVPSLPATEAPVPGELRPAD